MRLIDADALVEILGIKDDCADCEHVKGAFCTKGSEFVNACEAIFDAPTIDPVKHGKWIKNEGRCGWHCSVCATDDVYAFEWDSDKGEDELQDHYCPNCGARMERSEDDRPN